MTSSLDLIIRGGTVATAGDVVRCDIGVRGGRVVALGEDLGRAESVIDATGRLVTPGGIDSHCHMDQQPWNGQATIDDFRSGGPRLSADPAFVGAAKHAKLPELTSREDAERMVAAMIGLGADAIKLFTGSYAQRTSIVVMPVLTRSSTASAVAGGEWPVIAPVSPRQRSA